ncbi:hypothetical protein HOP52_07855 [Halomonas campisalis]|uniref:Uncharacterized protein n=1 Tax=Billgrantia campisalis TaxID=74661 RepID=A0ABS9P7C7_9GAMM|nr:hypothetical protein [Halomonas campisalis]MCG6657670.1 hypothetical protein [Halomonas campisalis]MDR5862558.1 hypothetical protein [Halomonas campisalis]
MQLRCRTLSSAVIAASMLLPVAGHSLADEVVEQIELGLELYQEAEYGAAITELEFAINDIRKLMSSRIGATFPDAPDGWTAGEVESAGGGAAAMLGGAGGTMLQRQYREQDGNGQLEASLMIDNPMVQGMAAMFSNPAMIAAQPNMERVRLGRESVIVKWEPDRSRAEATLLLDGRILMQVKGQNIASQETAVELLRAWDLAAVREQAAR